MLTIMSLSKVICIWCVLCAGYLAHEYGNEILRHNNGTRGGEEDKKKNKEGSLNFFFHVPNSNTV